MSSWSKGEAISTTLGDLGSSDDGSTPAPGTVNGGAPMSVEHAVRDQREGQKPEGMVSGMESLYEPAPEALPSVGPHQQRSNVPINDGTLPPAKPSSSANAAHHANDVHELSPVPSPPRPANTLLERALVSALPPDGKLEVCSPGASGLTPASMPLSFSRPSGALAESQDGYSLGSHVAQSQSRPYESLSSLLMQCIGDWLPEDMLEVRRIT